MTMILLTADTTGDAGFGFFLIGLILFGYFLPSFVALVRHNRQALAIFMLNLLLGWTVLGWIGAFVWAFVRE